MEWPATEPDMLSQTRPSFIVRSSCDKGFNVQLGWMKTIKYKDTSISLEVLRLQVSLG